MTFNCSSAKQRHTGFTLAEVLAALVFMAIVIPVAVEGLRVANLAGQVGTRRATAARIGENVLHELILSGQNPGLTAQGQIEEGNQLYRWTIHQEPWTIDAMQLLTVQVLFTVQGRDYDVQLSTLRAQSGS